MADRELLDKATQMWLRENGVRAAEVIEKSWPDSDSQVMRITTDDGKVFFLKRFQSAVKYSQAANAYQNWLASLEEVVPSLVSTNSQHRLLLLTDIGGCCCVWEELSPEQQSSLLRQAGRFLRATHDLPFVDDDSEAVGNAVLKRAYALQRRLRDGKTDSDILSCNLMTRVVENIEDVVAPLNQIKRVPCHRDFWRRNWVWTSAGGGQQSDVRSSVRLGVLDLEHARPDLFLFDFMKVWSDCWLDRPQLEQPFWDGYGRMLNDEERTLLKRCAAIHAAQTIVWGAEHKSSLFTAQGHRLLAAAMGDGNGGIGPQ